MTISKTSKIEENTAIYIVNGNWTAFAVRDCVTDDLVLFIPIIHYTSNRTAYKIWTFEEGSTYEDVFPSDDYNIRIHNTEEKVFSNLPFEVGAYATDEEATKAIQSKLEADKKEWFSTFYEKITKLTEKEKRLLYSAIKFLCLTGYCDFDDEDCEEMNGKELKKRSAVRLKIILTKILGKGCSCYDSKEKDAE